MSVVARHKRRRSPDGAMTLMEHLYELRRRLFVAILALLLGAIFGFIWFGWEIPGVGSLAQLMLHPWCSIPSTHRVDYGNGVCTLQAITPFSGLQVRIEAALLSGAVISSPFWFYQLWAFVTPALYTKERRFAVTFVGFAVVLFAGGAVLAYLVIPKALDVLASSAGAASVANFTVDSYFGFLVGILLIFGVSMELPLLLVMLNYAGVIKGRQLSKARRYALFGLVVFSALVIPSNDPLSMGALAVALGVLYEIAIWVCRAHDKRKDAARAESNFSDLADDVASPLPGLATPIGSAGGVAVADPLVRADPVAAPTPPPGASAAPAASSWSSLADPDPATDAVSPTADGAAAADPVADAPRPSSVWADGLDDAT